MTLSEKVREAAKGVMAATEELLSDALNRFVEAFIGWPFTVRPAIVEGLDGTRSAPFASVVCTAAGGGGVPDVGPVPADRAAALIDACEVLTVDSLSASYGRIGQAKQFRKSVRPKVKRAAGNTATLGIVLAVRSDLTLEAIAEEMRRLNEQTPGQVRPDIVVVASTGLVQYSAQFPGENVSGDFILPGETLSFAPPMYILMVMNTSRRSDLPGSSSRSRGSRSRSSRQPASRSRVSWSIGSSRSAKSCLRARTSHCSSRS